MTAKPGSAGCSQPKWPGTKRRKPGPNPILPKRNPKSQNHCGEVQGHLRLVFPHRGTGFYGTSDNRFAEEDRNEGYRMNGPIAVARFDLGESGEAEQREARVLRQREVNGVME